MVNHRRALTEYEKKLVSKWNGGHGITADVAKSVHRQGWISEKQSAVLLRNGESLRSRYYTSSKGYTQKDDYDESDYEIGAHELCVDGW